MTETSSGWNFISLLSFEEFTVLGWCFLESTQNMEFSFSITPSLGHLLMVVKK